MVTDGGPQAGSDASIQPGIDGGLPIPIEPPKPILDAAISGKPLGNAYAETQYNLERPAALQAPFGALALLAGDTRLFVNDVRQGDGGVEVLYGAADLIDGGLVWQKPPAMPGSFQIGVSPDGERAFASQPFNYVIEARVAIGGGVSRLYLEVVQTVWTATFSADYENIVTGALYGILTREEAEHRPLPLEACLAACGLIDLTYCAEADLHLSTALDCNDAQLDADSNGDGTNDGYRLILSFTSKRVANPVN